MKNKILLITVAVLLAISVVGMGCPPVDPDVVHIRIASGPVGGGWFPLAAALSSIIEDYVPGAHASPTLGGGVANVRDVEANKAQIGITFSGTARDGWMALPPFEEEHRNVRVIAALAPEPLSILSLAETGIETVDDLRGRPFSPGKMGFTGKVVFERMLYHLGMTFEDLGEKSLVGFSDGAMLLRDRHIDFYTPFDLPPTVPFMEVDAFFPISILQLPEDLLDTMVEKYGMVRITTPAGVYRGVEQDVEQVGYVNLLIVHKDVPENIVYDITKAMWEEVERLRAAVPPREAALIKLENALKGLTIPLHPGAYRFYVELGMTIPEVARPID